MKHIQHLDYNLIRTSSYLSTNLKECEKSKIEQLTAYDCLNWVVEFQCSISKPLAALHQRQTMADFSAFPKRKCSLVFCNCAVHRGHKQDHWLTSLNTPYMKFSDIQWQPSLPIRVFNKPKSSIISALIKPQTPQPCFYTWQAMRVQRLRLIG